MYAIFSSTNWNLLGKQNKCNTCDKQNYTNNKLYHSHFLCVFFFLPTGFEVRIKTVDKIVLLFKVNEVSKQKEGQSQNYSQYL